MNAQADGAERVEVRHDGVAKVVITLQVVDEQSPCCLGQLGNEAVQVLHR